MHLSHQNVEVLNRLVSTPSQNSNTKNSIMLWWVYLPQIDDFGELFIPTLSYDRLTLSVYCSHYLLHGVINLTNGHWLLITRCFSSKDNGMFSSHSFTWSIPWLSKKMSMFLKPLDLYCWHPLCNSEISYLKCRCELSLTQVRKDSLFFTALIGERTGISSETFSYLFCNKRRRLTRYQEPGLGLGSWC